METTLDSGRSRKRAVQTAEGPGRSRKQPRLAEENRKRGAFACESCHRLKEKCDGSVPCERCRRFDRKCEARRVGVRCARSSPEMDRQQSERTRHLEAIARHFLGELPQDIESLGRVVQSLPETTKDCVLDYSGQIEARRMINGLETAQTNDGKGLSHLDFCKQVCNAVETQLANSKSESFKIREHSKEDITLSNFASLAFVRDELPPREVADFLVKVYFDFAQVNAHFVCSPWTISEMEHLYSLEQNITVHDSPWVCTLLMVLAIGALFSHMANNMQEMTTNSSSSDAEIDSEMAVSRTFYETASKLVPNIIALGSERCVQACLMLAQYALCTNASNAAHTYLSLSLQIAYRSNANWPRQADQSSVDVSQSYDRLLKRTRSWEKRIRILHGLPGPYTYNSIGIMHGTRDLLTKQSESRPDNSEGIMDILTAWLDVFHNMLQRLVLSPEKLESTSLARIIQIRQEYKRWWSTDPTSQTPILQLNRSTAHLHLYYYLNLVYLGRSCIFLSPDRSNTADSDAISRAHAELVDDAEYAAYGIIDICSMLDKSRRLPRCGYIEASSCQAAVLVMLAQSLTGRCNLFQEKLEQGVSLLRQMTSNRESTNGEAAVILTIHSAIQQLRADSEQELSKQNEEPCGGSEAYEKFKQWLHHHEKQSQTPQTGKNATSADLDAFTCEIDWSPFGNSLVDIDLSGAFEFSAEVDDDLTPNLTGGMVV